MPPSSYWNGGSFWSGDPDDQAQSLGLMRARTSRMARMQLRNFTKGFVAMELTEGLEELIPNEDQNAWSGLTNLASTTISYGVMFGNAYGMTMGMIVAMFDELKKGASDLKKQVEDNFREQEKKNEHLERMIEHNNRHRQHIEDHARAQIQNLVNDRYLGFRDSRNGL